MTGVPAGALLVLATTADAVPSNCSVSSSPSLTWTKRADAGASQSDNAEIWTAVYTAGGSITVTCSWGAGNSQTSVCYVVLNAEATLGGASAIAISQTAPSVTITTTNENSIIFGCTADWKAINGATRTLRDAATEGYISKMVITPTTILNGGNNGLHRRSKSSNRSAGQLLLVEIRSATMVVDNPPTVLSVIPLNGTTGVPVGTFFAVFSEAMNASTISGSTSNCAMLPIH